MLLPRLLLPLAATLALAACHDQPTPVSQAANTAASAPAATQPAAPASSASAEQAWALAQQATGFTVGPIMASHTAYVFFDPACPHCAHLWTQAQPLLNRVKMVWVPVGFLRVKSPEVGATILTAPDPAAAMMQNERSVLDHGPGLEPSSSLPDGAVAKVKANTGLLQKTGAESVPLIVYRDAKTGQPATHTGAMDTADLAALIGVAP